MFKKVLYRHVYKVSLGLYCASIQYPKYGIKKSKNNFFVIPQNLINGGSVNNTLQVFENIAM